MDIYNDCDADTYRTTLWMPSTASTIFRSLLYGHLSSSTMTVMLITIVPRRGCLAQRQPCSLPEASLVLNILLIGSVKQTSY